MQTPIYLDHNATTPVDPQVLDAMLPSLREDFGNPSSRTHAHGWRAAEAVELARARVAACVGARPREVIFTSGATESNNLAVFGAVTAHRRRGRATRGTHVVTTAVEHHAMLDPAQRLAAGELGAPCEVTFVAPDREGRVSAEQVRDAIRDDTALVSVIAANNEVGTLAPLGAIAAVCRERSVLFHTDAAQALGATAFDGGPLDVARLGLDLVSVSSHKIYGPKGVGALIVRTGVSLAPRQFGGGQERDLRPGTLNVPGIVGLGAACELMERRRDDDARHARALRDHFLARVEAQLDGVRLNGPRDDRLPGNLNLSFEGVEGEALLVSLKDAMSVSSGSACTSSSPEPSHVLRAMGVSAELAHASVRFGFGRFNTLEEVDFATERLIDVVHRLREMRAAVSR